jgi:hypothetical protein
MSIPRNTPQRVQDCPILQWASGRTEAKLPGQSRFMGFVGFHSEIGADSALDAASIAAGTPKITIRHTREGDSPALVDHWSFGEQLAFYPVTAGPPYTTISACLKSPRTAEAGIGLTWPQGGRSRMAVRGYLLLGTQPVLVQLSVKSTMTDCLLAALLDHMRVVAAADDLVDRKKHPEIIAAHEISLPLRAGDEVTVGRGETTQITPLVSAHPATIDRAYITKVYRPRAIDEAAQGAWDDVVAWSVGYASGETNGDSHM